MEQLWKQTLLNIGTAFSKQAETGAVSIHRTIKCSRGSEGSLHSGPAGPDPAVSLL